MKQEAREQSWYLDPKLSSTVVQVLVKKIDLEVLSEVVYPVDEHQH